MDKGAYNAPSKKSDGRKETNAMKNSSLIACVTAVASIFSFTGMARFFAGLFCYYYRFYGKSEYGRLDRLLLA